MFNRVYSIVVEQNRRLVMVFDNYAAKSMIDRVYSMVVDQNRRSSTKIGVYSMDWSTKIDD